MYAMQARCRPISLLWEFLCVMAAGLLACATGNAQTTNAASNAGAYPVRPITLIIPFAAGGSADVLGRYVAQKLSESLGQPIVVDNRAGAGGIIGSQVVARAAPDGYTLLWTTSGHAINPSIFAKLPYDTNADFTPIAHIANIEVALAVNSAVPASNIKELIALAKSKPKAMNYGTAGEGSLGHLGGLLFNKLGGIDLVEVPYKGTPQAEMALLTNDVQVFFTPPMTAAPHVRSGKIRVLAIGSLKRSPSMPDAPTLDDSGLRGYEVIGLFGVAGPAGMPALIVQRLNTELNRILARSDVKEWFQGQGVSPASGSAADFAKLIANDIQKWQRVLKEAGFQPKN